MTDNKDSKLWRQARARMGFRIHFTMYVCINLLMWVVWATYGIHTHPWPVYLLVGWGIGILFHFLGTYRHFDKMAEKEYKKLKNTKRLF